MKIGVFTASTPIGALFPERANRAIAFLESKGHEVIKGPLFYKKDSYRSGSIKDRADEINYLIDQNVEILLSSIGGANTGSLLPFVNYEKINANKLIICGFSDTTSLLNAVVRRCPQARVIYSAALTPNFGEFESESQEKSYQALFNLITNREVILQPLPFFYTNNKNWDQYEEERSTKTSTWDVFNQPSCPEIKGRLWGGNGNTLMSLFGSEFLPDFQEGDILFIEDAEKNDADMERIFNAFFLNKYFNKAQAIILGRHASYKGTVKPSQILKEILEVHNLKKPIIFDVDISHCRPMLALELNKQTKINFKERIIWQTR